MAKPAELENLAWGTLEELLLACAINRYGTDSWDSVAKEVQKRSSTAANSFTSHNCKQKYYDLKRRFASQTDLAGGATLKDGGGVTIPWLDVLRRRRIAELKQDLERFDLSIGSLQLKLKRLSEEREKSLIEKEREGSDLQRTEPRERVDDREEEERNRKKTSSPPLSDAGAVGGASAVESDQENNSINASNSSDPKAEKSGANRDQNAREKKPAEPSADPPADSVEETIKPASDDSYNGSTDWIALAKGPAGSVKTEPVYDSHELVESIPELKLVKEEEGRERETSDVQSSLSLSGKKRRCKRISLSNSGAEAKNQSAAHNCASLRPPPLADLLDVIRQHKFGSLFERRLDSQKSPKYKKMIRQHIDLATIRKNLEQGVYSDCHSKFYRDVLLLITNATVFFPKRSPEHKSTIELRQLVCAKLGRHPSKLKPESPAADSPPLLTSPVIACRKRSSIALRKTPGEEKNKSVSGGSSFSTVKKKRSRDQISSDSRVGKNVEVEQKKRKNNDNANSNEDMSGGRKSGEKGKDQWNSSRKGKQEEGSNGDDSKRNSRRPPKRAVAVAGEVKRRSDGGGGKAEGALPKKRSRK